MKFVAVLIVQISISIKMKSASGFRDFYNINVMYS